VGRIRLSNTKRKLSGNYLEKVYLGLFLSWGRRIVLQLLRII